MVISAYQNPLAFPQSKLKSQVRFMPLDIFFERIPFFIHPQKLDTNNKEPCITRQRHYYLCKVLQNGTTGPNLLHRSISAISYHYQGSCVCFPHTILVKIGDQIIECIRHVLGLATTTFYIAFVILEFSFFFVGPVAVISFGGLLIKLRVFLSNLLEKPGLIQNDIAMKLAHHLDFIRTIDTRGHFD